MWVEREGEVRVGGGRDGGVGEVRGVVNEVHPRDSSSPRWRLTAGSPMVWVSMTRRGVGGGRGRRVGGGEGGGLTQTKPTQLLRLLSQCGSTYTCLSRSIPEIHWHVAGRQVSGKQQQQ